MCAWAFFFDVSVWRGCSEYATFSGAVVGTCTSGSTNWNSIGRERAAQSLCEAITGCVEAAGNYGGQCEAVYQITSIKVVMCLVLGVLC